MSSFSKGRVVFYVTSLERLMICVRGSNLVTREVFNLYLNKSKHSFSENVMKKIFLKCIVNNESLYSRHVHFTREVKHDVDSNNL